MPCILTNFLTFVYMLWPRAGSAVEMGVMRIMRRTGWASGASVEYVRSSGGAQKPSTLYAFFDLEICSVSFDFLNWLLRAEQHRRESGARHTHVVFVPGANDGFNLSHLDPWVKRWRLDTVCVAACALLDSVGGVTLCGTRAEAGALESESGGNVFPPGYTTSMYDSESVYATARDAMVDAWLLGGTVVRHICGKELPVLGASGAARQYVQDWLAPRARDRKVIVLTLRDSNHARYRNVRSGDWLRFAASLDPNVYYPVIVRDTEALYYSQDENGRFDVCDAAACDLDIRIALYEAAYLNLLVNNGPLAICYLNPAIRFIAYRFARTFDEEGLIPYVELYGIPYRGQIPFANEFQRIVWDDDEFEVLARAFDEMVSRLEAAEADGTLQARLRRRRVGRQEALAVAMALHKSDQLYAAARLYAWLLDQDRTDAKARAMLGLLLYHTGSYKEAAAVLEAAVTILPDHAALQFNLGNAYRRLNDFAQADRCFEGACAISPESWDAWANRGETRRTLGDLSGALQCYRRALQLGPVDARTVLDAASALMEDGRYAEACTAFELLHNHYRRRSQRILEQTVCQAPWAENSNRLGEHPYMVPAGFAKRGTVAT